MPYTACEHGVVSGRCNWCLADQLAKEEAILRHLRAVAFNHDDICPCPRCLEARSEQPDI
jgi:hypothetical protein